VTRQPASRKIGSATATTIAPATAAAGGRAERGSVQAASDVAVLDHGGGNADGDADDGAEGEPIAEFPTAQPINVPTAMTAAVTR